MEKMVAQYDELFSDLLSKEQPRVMHLISSSGFYGAEKVILQIAQSSPHNQTTLAAIRNRHNRIWKITDEAGAGDQNSCV